MDLKKTDDEMKSALKRKPEKVVLPNEDYQKPYKPNSTGELMVIKTKGEAELMFKPKYGSVFPAKRRLVKTMIFFSILQFFSDFAGGFSKAKNMKTKNDKLIYPHPP